MASGVFVLSSTFTTGAQLFKISSLSPRNTTDFLVFAGGSVLPMYIDAYGWVHCNSSAPAGTYFFNLSGVLA